MLASFCASASASESAYGKFDISFLTRPNLHRRQIFKMQASIFGKNHWIKTQNLIPDIIGI